MAAEPPRARPRPKSRPRRPAERSEAGLDCPSGPDSFVAAARERGATVVGADVAYTQSREGRGASDGRPAGPPNERAAGGREQATREPESASDGRTVSVASRETLARRSREDVAAVAAQHEEKRDLFAWEFYDDPAERRAYLDRARDRFLADYPDGPYVAAALPDLPFADGAFSLVLSAHFLFLYDDRLDHGFHVDALRELARVASREVRVFPLVGLDTSRYDRLDDVLAALDADGYGVAVRDVPFEFQRGATEMLVVEV